MPRQVLRGRLGHVGVAAVDDERDNALPVNPRAALDAREAQPGGRKVNIAPQVVKRAARFDPQPTDQMDPNIKIIDVSLVEWEVEFSELEAVIL